MLPILIGAILYSVISTSCLAGTDFTATIIFVGKVESRSLVKKGKAPVDEECSVKNKVSFGYMYFLCLLV